MTTRFEVEMLMDLDEVLRLNDDMFKRGLASALQYIHSHWPVWTGYSLLNTYLDVNGEGAATPTPARRPTTRDILADAANQHILELFAKIYSLDLKADRGRNAIHTVILGNPVDYAADASFTTPGLGAQIYEDAARLAEAEIELVARGGGTIGGP